MCIRGRAWYGEATQHVSGWKALTPSLGEPDLLMSCLLKEPLEFCKRSTQRCGAGRRECWYIAYFPTLKRLRSASQGIHFMNTARSAAAGLITPTITSGMWPAKPKPH